MPDLVLFSTIEEGIPGDLAKALERCGELRPNLFRVIYIVRSSRVYVKFLYYRYSRRQFTYAKSWLAVLSKKYLLAETLDYTCLLMLICFATRCMSPCRFFLCT